MARFQGHLSVRLMEVCEEIDSYIKSLTPVYTGQTVRNYIWTTGAPNMTVFEAIDNGPPGHTNDLPLGVEPRRSANEEAARESLMGLDFANPFQTFYLTNNAPAVGGLELGMLPNPPLKSRSPNGMFGLTHEYINTKIGIQGFIR